MEKMKKVKPWRFLGMKITELCAVLSLIGGATTGVVVIVHHFDKKFENIDHRFDSVDRRLDKVESRLNNVESRLDNLEVEVKRTSDLLNSYLTWRFLYVHDPKRKNIEPRYNPNERTLEFVDKSAIKGE